MLGPAKPRSPFGQPAASRHLRRLALGATAVALLVTSVTALAASDRLAYRLSVPGAEPTFRGPVNLRGASVAQRALFDEILAGLLESRIASIRVDVPPPDYEPEDPIWLYIGVRVNEDTDYVRALWQASLVAGLFRDVSAERGLPLPGGKTLILVHPDGREEIFSESLIAQPRAHFVEAVATSRLDHELRSALRNENLSVRALRFTRPLGRPGIELSATTDDPRGFWVRQEAFSIGSSAGRSSMGDRERRAPTSKFVTPPEASFTGGDTAFAPPTRSSTRRPSADR